MLPLFAASYFGGQLLSKGERPRREPAIINRPPPAVLFSANAITGSWNLWEGKDPNGRTRRILDCFSRPPAAASCRRHHAGR
jgi:hypothetical protein